MLRCIGVNLKFMAISCVKGGAIRSAPPRQAPDQGRQEVANKSVRSDTYSNAWF
jgi:hypothetical protein